MSDNMCIETGRGSFGTHLFVVCLYFSI